MYVLQYLKFHLENVKNVFVELNSLPHLPQHPYTTTITCPIFSILAANKKPSSLSAIIIIII